MIESVELNDYKFVSALVEQVGKAIPKGGMEFDVTTVISRPMWQRFMRALGGPVLRNLVLTGRLNAVASTAAKQSS